MSEMHRKVFNKMKLHAMAAEVLYLLGGTSIDCGVQVNKFLNENKPSDGINELQSGLSAVLGMHATAWKDAAVAGTAVPFPLIGGALTVELHHSKETFTNSMYGGPHGPPYTFTF